MGGPPQAVPLRGVAQRSRAYLRLRQIFRAISNVLVFEFSFKGLPHALSARWEKKLFAHRLMAVTSAVGALPSSTPGVP